MPLASITVCTSGALLTALRPSGVRSVTVHGTLKPGSSNEGKLARASIDSCWVHEYQSSPTLMWNMPAGPSPKGAS